jgi:hypothetical protein
MKTQRDVNRRKFLKLSAAGAAVAGAAALAINSPRLFSLALARENNLKMDPQDVKKIFWKCGACSHTFFHILNHEFGYPKETEERAADPLAGGLMLGQQCGMLWGSALAVGAESFRRNRDSGRAVATAITATRHVVNSFARRAKTVNCHEITFDFSNKAEMAKFMLKSMPGGFANMVCMDLAEKWAPEAIRSAKEGLHDNQTDLPDQPASCASEVARMMGAGEEEMVTVAGFAGGLGLSGNACGALGAAMYLNSLTWCRKNQGNNPAIARILKTFNDVTGSEIRCQKISGKCFGSVADHTGFIKNGGCSQLITALAHTV